MGFTPYQLFLAGLMLVTGTINTLSTKWADRQTSEFCDGSGQNITFEHPFLQAVGMFIGEFLCLLAFKFIWYSTARYRIQQMTYKGDASSALVNLWPINIKKDIRLVDGEQVFNPLIFWIASIFDMLSTCLSYFALNLTTASSFQMLRGSVMVFTALMSILFLKKRLNGIQWLGIGTVVTGLVVVGVSDLLFDKTKEGNHSSGEKVAGILLILLAMLFTSGQVVYEERFIGKYNIPPLQAVGWEGIFGFLTLSLVIIPFHFIHLKTSNSGPEHRLEDVPEAFCQMGHNYIIIIATVGNILSIAFFNFAGISVTKELSSTTRMVLDSGRTLIIWAVSLALSWQKFYPLQIVGFVLLVIGMGIYNGVWQSLYRQLFGRQADDQAALIPDYTAANPYAISNPANVPTGAGIVPNILNVVDINSSKLNRVRAETCLQLKDSTFTVECGIRVSIQYLRDLFTAKVDECYFNKQHGSIDNDSDTSTTSDDNAAISPKRPLMLLAAEQANRQAEMKESMNEKSSFIHCEINATIRVYFPSIILPSYHNNPLSEQAEYDLKNTLRKTNEFLDVDDDDYIEDDDVESIEQLTTEIVTTVTMTTTVSQQIRSEPIKSLSSRFLLNWFYLLLSLLILTQTSK
ncbi:unnamed protein product [Adineta ricciae]|uniref:Uncharacterized protein n=1 Tax=Adineta ricciae TaxID=249248 RepID=A0A814QVM1_ADIRI|nr:unnamed protein product [Adineta ricciae]